MADDQPVEDGEPRVPEHIIERGFYLVIFGWVAYLMWLAFDLTSSARLVPLLVGVPVLILTLLQLIPIDWTAHLDRHLPGSPRDQSDEGGGLTDRMESEGGHSPAVEQRVAFEVVGWVLGLAVLIHLFGFYYTLPPYVFALTWYLTRDVRRAALVTVVFVAVVTLLFIVLFEQRLFRGMIDLPHPYV